MHKIVYLPLAESDLMDALGYITYTLDAPKAAREKAHQQEQHQHERG